MAIILVIMFVDEMQKQHEQFAKWCITVAFAFLCLFLMNLMEEHIRTESTKTTGNQSNQITPTIDK